MSVYVDTIVVYPNAWGPFKKGSCHLVADTLDELHAFAEKLGMRRAWFQDTKHMPHYDLTPKRREEALRLGAVSISTMELARRGRAARLAQGSTG